MEGPRKRGAATSSVPPSHILSQDDLENFAAAFKTTDPGPEKIFGADQLDAGSVPGRSERSCDCLKHCVAKAPREADQSEFDLQIHTTV
jgi:hypothetical protein